MGQFGSQLQNVLRRAQHPPCSTPGYLTLFVPILRVPGPLSTYVPTLWDWVPRDVGIPGGVWVMRRGGRHSLRLPRPCLVCAAQVPSAVVGHTPPRKDQPSC